MKILIVLDDNGHLNAFDASSQKVWLGLGMEALKKNHIDMDVFSTFTSLVADKKWKEAQTLLIDKDVIATGRSSSNRFDVVEVSDTWEEGLAQFNNE